MTAEDSKKNNKEQTQKEHNNTHSPKESLGTETKRENDRKNVHYR